MGKSYTTAKGGTQKQFDIDGIQFFAAPNVPGQVILDFAELTTGSVDGNIPTSKVIPAIKAFFAASLTDESLERFNALLRDKNHPVDIDLLVEIAGDLAGEYSARPTGGSSSDTSPTTESGPNSMDGAPHRGLTFSRPDPADSTSVGSSI